METKYTVKYWRRDPAIYVFSAGNIYLAPFSFTANRITINSNTFERSYIMAKKFGKFLWGVLIVGAVIAGGIAFFNKYKNKNQTSDSNPDEFEDEFAEEFTVEFEDAADEDTTQVINNREYVTIPTENNIEQSGETLQNRN